MKILLLGANGQVGWELQRSLAPLGELAVCTREQVDFTRPQSLARLVEQARPRVIVNAAAYTAVDKAESDEATARQVNAESVGVLARAAAESGAWLVHYSTDYVFDGEATAPYKESDPPRPLSAYGRTKLEGEQAVQASGCKHLILRTSWVYAARGNNFAKTMLRLASERDALRVVADQFGAPTSAELIADVTCLMLQRLGLDATLAQTGSGLYHLAAAGETSWHAYAQYVIAHAQQQGAQVQVTPERIEAIGTADYPVPARRPASSRLDISKLQQTFGLRLPDWRLHMDRMLREISA